MIDISRWRLTEARSLLNQQYGDQYVIFCPSSGDTHLVQEIGMYVLAVLEQGATTDTELAEKIAVEFNTDEIDDLRGYLSALLSEFKNLSIIERIDS